MTNGWRPLVCTSFVGLQQCSEALQVLRRADRVGKMVVEMPLLVREGSYVLTGGTGALGRCVARVLLEEGAQDAEGNGRIKA